MSDPDLHHLPRLERRYYQGFAAVHWSMRVEPATPGWLDADFHQRFRELMLHACTRERLWCPAYCLMLDHLHLVWMGMAEESDQVNGMKFLREHLNRLLRGEISQGLTSTARKAGEWKGWRLQKQAYDHVLKEEERGGFCERVLLCIGESGAGGVGGEGAGVAVWRLCVAGISGHAPDGGRALGDVLEDLSEMSGAGEELATDSRPRLRRR